MATLSSILNNRIADFAPDETNLEDGEIYVFCSGREFGCFTSCLAWTAPAAGTAKIEIWGSGGSVGCQCCCNYSIGGQSGAYSRKDVTMGADGYVCGNTGHPCMPNAGFCYSGCSAQVHQVLVFVCVQKAATAEANGVVLVLVTYVAYKSAVLVLSFHLK